jgi:uncharacterized membrane protein required for colicin V production
MSETFNLFDLIFMAFSVIILIVAFFRGFVKEIFSLFNWVVAFVISHLLSPFISGFFNSSSISSTITDIGVRSVVFVSVFFIVMLSTSGFCKEVQKKIPDPFDKSLGVFYGLVKILLIFGVTYALFINSLELFLNKKINENSKEYPKFLKEARFHGVIKFSGEFVSPMVKGFFEGMSESFDKESLNKIQPKNILDKKIDDILENKDDASKFLDKTNKESGYNKRDIEKMNRLIEIINN